MLNRLPLLNLFVILFLGITIPSNDSFAQEATEKKSKQTKKEPALKTEKKQPSSSTAGKFSKAIEDSKTDQQKKKREKAITAGSILIVGILMLGFFLIAIILVWGRTTRRLAKSRGSKQTVIDPLWYLKSQKKENSVSPSDGQNDPDHLDSTSS